MQRKSYTRVKTSDRGGGLCKQQVVLEGALFFSGAKIPETVVSLLIS